MYHQLFAALVYVAPLASLIILSCIGFASKRLQERTITRIVSTGLSISLLSAIYLGVLIVFYHFRTGIWLSIPVFHHHLFSFGHHEVQLDLRIDHVSAGFVIMATMLSNIVGVFSKHYLHRDPGFFRFFFLIVLFLVGVLTVFLASNFQNIFIGWELMGITSALLISFFTLRAETIDNALHAFWAYRVSDVGILLASIILLAQFPDATFGDAGGAVLPTHLVYLIPLLLLLSAMGKSAQFPFSSWLPRAMEGPTSSSAIFYGGLSIHAGVYLLLRLRLEYQVPIAVLIAIGLIGIVSCAYGALLSQVQSDVKSALAYASLSQVGIMFVEVSLGWFQLAVFHCLGHAFLRTYQILKCSSVIHQFAEFSDAHQDMTPTNHGSIISLFLTPAQLNKIFSFGFDVALRAATGASTMVICLERISRTLQSFEEWSLRVVTGIRRS